MRILYITGILSLIGIVVCYVSLLVKEIDKGVHVQDRQKMVEQIHHSNQLIQKKIWGGIYPKEKHEPVR